MSYFICSDPDDVLKAKTFSHSSFYYPPIFLCFISGNFFFITYILHLSTETYLLVSLSLSVQILLLKTRCGNACNFISANFLWLVRFCTSGPKQRRTHDTAYFWRQFYGLVAPSSVQLEDERNPQPWQNLGEKPPQDALIAVRCPRCGFSPSFRDCQ